MRRLDLVRLLAPSYTIFHLSWELVILYTTVEGAIYKGIIFPREYRREMKAWEW